MVTSSFFRIVIISFIACILILALAACTSSTPTQVATQPSTPETSGQTAENTPTPLAELVPTNTIEPTPIPPTPTPQPEPLKITSQGFGQEGRNLGYAFLVENVNSGIILDSTTYSVTAFDAGGNVVKEEQNRRIGLIFPNQTLGVASRMFIDEGVTVEKIEIQLAEGAVGFTDWEAPISAELIRYFPAPSEYSSASVTGILTNRLDRTLTSINLYAIAYNEAGEIIGGGADNLNFIPANGRLGVDVRGFYSTGTPDRVELYATPFTYSGTEEREILDMVLLKQGIGQGLAGKMGVGAIIQNRSDVAGYVYIHVTLYAEDGSVVAVEKLGVTLTPNQTLGLADDLSIPDGTEVSRAEFTLFSWTSSKPQEYLYFPVEALSTQANQGRVMVTGEITNPLAEDVTNVNVMGIAYNGAGEIIGGGQSWGKASANAKGEVFITLYTSDGFDSVELYAMKSASAP
jgi:hypothetical protein